MSIKLYSPSMCASGLVLLCSAAYAQNVVYVANQVSGSVSAIDGATNTVVQTIPVSPAPWQMAVNPDATRVYVSLASQNPVNKALAVIDIATNTLVATIPLDFYPGPLALTLDGSHAWVTAGGPNDVRLVNLATGSVEAIIGIGGVPVGIALSPNGTRCTPLDW